MGFSPSAAPAPRHRAPLQRKRGGAAIDPFGQLSPKSVDNLVDEPEKYEKTAAKTLLLLNWSEIDHIAKYLLYQQHTAPISDPCHFVYTIFGTASMFLRDCA